MFVVRMLLLLLLFVVVQEYKLFRELLFDRLHTLAPDTFAHTQLQIWGCRRECTYLYLSVVVLYRKDSHIRNRCRARFWKLLMVVNPNENRGLDYTGVCTCIYEYMVCTSVADTLILYRLDYHSNKPKIQSKIRIVWEMQMIVFPICHKHRYAHWLQ